MSDCCLCTYFFLHFGFTIWCCCYRHLVGCVFCFFLVVTYNFVFFFQIFFTALQILIICCCRQCRCTHWPIGLGVLLVVLWMDVDFSLRCMHRLTNLTFFTIWIDRDHHWPSKNHSEETKFIQLFCNIIPTWGICHRAATIQMVFLA